MTRLTGEKQPFSKSFMDKSKALNLFKNQEFKKELINTADSTEGVDDNHVSVYSNKDFIDLCRGICHAGHVRALERGPVGHGRPSRHPAGLQLDVSVGGDDEREQRDAVPRVAGPRGVSGERHRRVRRVPE